MCAELHAHNLRSQPKFYGATASIGYWVMLGNQSAEHLISGIALPSTEGTEFRTSIQLVVGLIEGRELQLAVPLHRFTC